VGDERKRIILLSRGELGLYCYHLLKRYGFEVCAVVSNNSYAHLSQPYLFSQAIIDDIPFVSNDKRNEEELIRIIKAKKVEYLLSVQHIWVLSKKVLNLVKGAYNIHNAKLPNYKGYYSISHAILNGDKTYTSTVHYMAPKVDSGDIIFEKTIEIAQTDTAK